MDEIRRHPWLASSLQHSDSLRSNASGGYEEVEALQTSLQLVLPNGAVLDEHGA